MRDEQVNEIKRLYPPGTRVKLIYMEDQYAVPEGTMGTVDFVDDAGQIQMKWDNGRTLALIYGVDKFEKINDKENIIKPEEHSEKNKNKERER